MAELRVKGLADLQKVLDELPAKVEQRVLRGGLRAGAKVIEEEARRRVPVKSGALRDSVRVSTSSRRGRVTARIRAGNAKAFYAHMVEFGTQRHPIEAPPGKALLLAGGQPVAKVDHPGSAPRPFMRPALDASAEAALAGMADYLRERLPRELAKK